MFTQALGSTKQDPAHLHGRLLRLAQEWAARREYDAAEAADLRSQAVLLNHRHYLTNIPAYAAFARDAGIGAETTVSRIASELTSTDDIFKSYDPTWLDERRFDRMNEWLGKIYHERISVDVSDVTS